MNLKSITLALVFALTTSAALKSLAYIVPGPGQTDSGKPNNDPGRPGQYNPPPNQGGGGYYPPPRPPGGGGGYYPPPNHGGGGYYPPPNHGGGGYYPPPPRPPAPPYYPPAPPAPYYPPAPPAPPAYGQRIVQQVYVGRSVCDEMFQLSYYANLSQYYGWQVTAVRANTRPNSPYRTVVSLVDGRRNIFATQTNPGYQIMLFPAGYISAGTQDLYLWIQGSTFIETIEVELLRN